MDNENIENLPCEIEEKERLHRSGVREVLSELQPDCDSLGESLIKVKKRSPTPPPQPPPPSSIRVGPASETLSPESEKWKERNVVLTSLDHEENISIVTDLLDDMVVGASVRSVQLISPIKPEPPSHHGHLGNVLLENSIGQLDHSQDDLDSVDNTLTRVEDISVQESEASCILNSGKPSLNSPCKVQLNVGSLDESVSGKSSGYGNESFVTCKSDDSTDDVFAYEETKYYLCNTTKILSDTGESIYNEEAVSDIVDTPKLGYKKSANDTLSSLIDGFNCLSLREDGSDGSSSHSSSPVKPAKSSSIPLDVQNTSNVHPRNPFAIQKLSERSSTVESVLCKPPFSDSHGVTFESKESFCGGVTPGKSPSSSGVLDSLPEGTSSVSSNITDNKTTYRTVAESTEHDDETFAGIQHTSAVRKGIECSEDHSSLKHNLSNLLSKDDFCSSESFAQSFAGIDGATNPANTVGESSFESPTDVHCSEVVSHALDTSGEKLEINNLSATGSLLSEVGVCRPQEPLDITTDEIFYDTTEISNQKNVEENSNDLLSSVSISNKSPMKEIGDSQENFENKSENSFSASSVTDLANVSLPLSSEHCAFSSDSESNVSSDFFSNQDTSQVSKADESVVKTVLGEILDSIPTQHEEATEVESALNSDKLTVDTAVTTPPEVEPVLNSDKPTVNTEMAIPSEVESALNSDKLTVDTALTTPPEVESALNSDKLTVNTAVTIPPEVESALNSDKLTMNTALTVPPEVESILNSEKLIMNTEVIIPPEVESVLNSEKLTMNTEMAIPSEVESALNSDKLMVNTEMAIPPPEVESALNSDKLTMNPEVITPSKAKITEVLMHNHEVENSKESELGEAQVCADLKHISQENELTVELCKSEQDGKKATGTAQTMSRAHSENALGVSSLIPLNVNTEDSILEEEFGKIKLDDVSCDDLSAIALHPSAVDFEAEPVKNFDVGSPVLCTSNSNKLNAGEKQSEQYSATSSSVHLDYLESVHGKCGVENNLVPSCDMDITDLTSHMAAVSLSKVEDETGCLHSVSNDVLECSNLVLNYETGESLCSCEPACQSSDLSSVISDTVISSDSCKVEVRDSLMNKLDTNVLEMIGSLDMHSEKNVPVVCTIDSTLNADEKQNEQKDFSYCAPSDSVHLDNNLESAYGKDGKFSVENNTVPSSDMGVTDSHVTAISSRSVKVETSCLQGVSNDVVQCDSFVLNDKRGECSSNSAPEYQPDVSSDASETRDGEVIDSLLNKLDTDRAEMIGGFDTHSENSVPSLECKETICLLPEPSENSQEICSSGEVVSKPCNLTDPASVAELAPVLKDSQQFVNDKVDAAAVNVTSENNTEIVSDISTVGNYIATTHEKCVGSATKKLVLSDNLLEQPLSSECVENTHSATIDVENQVTTSLLSSTQKDMESSVDMKCDEVNTPQEACTVSNSDLLNCLIEIIPSEKSLQSKDDKTNNFSSLQKDEQLEQNVDTVQSDFNNLLFTGSAEPDKNIAVLEAKVVETDVLNTATVTESSSQGVFVNISSNLFLENVKESSDASYITSCNDVPHSEGVSVLSDGDHAHLTKDLQDGGSAGKQSNTKGISVGGIIEPLLILDASICENSKNKENVKTDVSQHTSESSSDMLFNFAVESDNCAPNSEISCSSAQEKSGLHNLPVCNLAENNSEQLFQELNEMNFSDKFTSELENKHSNVECLMSEGILASHGNKSEENSVEKNQSPCSKDGVDCTSKSSITQLSQDSGSANLLNFSFPSVGIEPDSVVSLCFEVSKKSADPVVSMGFKVSKKSSDSVSVEQETKQVDQSELLASEKLENVHSAAVDLMGTSSCTNFSECLNEKTENYVKTPETPFDQVVPDSLNMLEPAISNRGDFNSVVTSDVNVFSPESKFQENEVFFDSLQNYRESPDLLSAFSDSVKPGCNISEGTVDIPLQSAMDRCDKSLIPGCESQQEAMDTYQEVQSVCTSDSITGMPDEDKRTLDIFGLGTDNKITTPAGQTVETYGGVITEDQKTSVPAGRSTVENEFKPASSFFKDPSAFDFLQNVGNSKAAPESQLSRLSLFFKFDPLVSGSPRKEDKNIQMPKDKVSDVENYPRFSTALFAPEYDTSNLVNVDQSSSKKVTKLFTEEEVNQGLKIQELMFQERLLKEEREFNRKLKAEQDEIEELKKQCQLMNEAYNASRENIMDVLRFMQSCIQKKQDQRGEIASRRQKIEDERDQALQDLQSVEKAFSDLMRRYENAKSLLETMKQNENSLTYQVDSTKQKIKDQEKMYEMLRSQAEEKLEMASNEIQKAKKGTEGDIAVLTAMIRKAEMKTRSLEKALEQVTKENTELSSICDDLMSKVER